jgi:hypothetical protein
MMMSSSKFPCPCCRFLTRTCSAPGTFELCRVCFWEDDEAQFEDPDYDGGANQVSLERGASLLRGLRRLRRGRPREGSAPDARGGAPNGRGLTVCDERGAVDAFGREVCRASTQAMIPGWRHYGRTVVDGLGDERVRRVL